MKRFGLLIIIFCISLLSPNLKVSAHSFGNYVLINNEFLIEDYNGPDSSILTYNQHYVGEYFSVNEDIDFKVRLNELGFLFDLDCEVILSNGETIKADPYEVNYEGLNTYYKGVEFNLKFKETGTYRIQIICKKPGSEDSRKFVDEYITINIGEHLIFPETVLVDNNEATFRNPVTVNANSDIEFKIREPQKHYEYIWEILDGSEERNIQNGIEIKNKFNVSEKPTYIILKVYDPVSRIFENNYFSVVPKTQESFFSKHSDVINVIGIIGILAMIITPILIYLKRNRLF